MTEGYNLSRIPIDGESTADDTSTSSMIINTLNSRDSCCHLLRFVIIELFVTLITLFLVPQYTLISQSYQFTHSAQEVLPTLHHNLTNENHFLEISISFHQPTALAMQSIVNFSVEVSAGSVTAFAYNRTLPVLFSDRYSAPIVLFSSRMIQTELYVARICLSGEISEMEAATLSSQIGVTATTAFISILKFILLSVFTIALGFVAWDYFARDLTFWTKELKSSLVCLSLFALSLLTYGNHSQNVFIKTISFLVSFVFSAILRIAIRSFVSGVRRQGEEVNDVFVLIFVILLDFSANLTIVVSHNSADQLHGEKIGFRFAFLAELLFAGFLVSEFRKARRLLNESEEGRFWGYFWFVAFLAVGTVACRGLEGFALHSGLMMMPEAVLMTLQGGFVAVMVAYHRAAGESGGRYAPVGEFGDGSDLIGDDDEEAID
jgi:hypothetical protein